MNVLHEGASNVCTFLKVLPFSCRLLSLSHSVTYCLHQLSMAIIVPFKFCSFMFLDHSVHSILYIHSNVLSPFNFRFDLPLRLRVMGCWEQWVSLTIAFDPESKTDTGHICAKYLLYADLYICKSHPRWHLIFD